MGTSVTWPRARAIRRAARSGGLVSPAELALGGLKGCVRHSAIDPSRRWSGQAEGGLGKGGKARRAGAFVLSAPALTSSNLTGRLKLDEANT
jgi:hypothetical protein